MRTSKPANIDPGPTPNPCPEYDLCLSQGKWLHPGHPSGPGRPPKADLSDAEAWRDSAPLCPAGLRCIDGFGNETRLSPRTGRFANREKRAANQGRYRHYVYGVLHDPVYREKYALNLKRECPRIPFYPDFWRWVEWGERLMMLISRLRPVT